MTRGCLVIETGQLVAGRYRLLETIGSGAMGVVWRARDERLERVIAIKQLIIRPGLTAAKTEEARRRAMREARIAARLHHRNAVALLDVAEHDGDPCLVMEFVNARSLSAVIAERGTLPPDEVAAIGSQVAAALAAAHAAGIVHRDVKPGNILIDDQGTVKITDFGISKADGDHTITTDTGVLAGTPAYLAPEQARGQQPSKASDVFSLGSTLYHALEGSPPFGLNPNPLALLHAVASGDVQPPRNGGPLTPTLMTLLRTEPSERPSMQEAASTLAVPTAPLPVPPPAMVERTVPARKAPPAPPRRTPPPRQSPPARPAQAPAPGPKRGVLIGAAAVVVGLAAAVVLVLTLPDNGTTATPGTETKTVTHSHPPTTTTSGAVSAPPTGTSKVTNYEAAGQTMISFYLSSTSIDARWALLTPNAQAAFGSKAAFAEHWGQYEYIASKKALVDGLNDDGSANVSADVTYTDDDGGETSERKTVRMVNIGGKHLIDSDPR